MKITSFAKIKGGVGATTIAYNYGEWLANKGYKVLFIDFDHQCNLTQTYNVFENDGTVANIFNGKGEVNILPVKENIDLIAGYIRLDNLEKELETKSYKDMLLYMWFEDNYDSKSSKELVVSLKDDENVLAMIPQKELFNRSTLDKKSLSDMMKDKELYSRNKAFFKDIDFTFHKITDTI